MRNGQKIVDPNEIESRFSQQDGMAYMNTVFSDPSEESIMLVQRVRELLPMLPAREADYIRLYFFNNLTQVEIADIFNVTQPTISYRLNRSAKRMQFLLRMPNLSHEQIEEGVRSFLDNEFDVQIMLLMNEHICQSEVARQLGVTQGKVRHRFIKYLKKMAEIPELSDHYRLFTEISNNLNILREVRRITPGDDTLEITIDF